MAKLVIFLAAIVFATDFNNAVMITLVCRSTELLQIGVCIAPFSAAASPLVGTNNCTLSDTMCTTAIASATCLNVLQLSGRCWSELPSKLDEILKVGNITCTVDDIEQNCLGVKINRYPCTSSEIDEVDICLKLFTYEDCKVDTNCKPAEDTVACLNKLTITKDCRATLAEFVNDELINSNFNCNTTDIEELCPKAKLLSNSSASSAMFSFVCFLLSVLVGLQ